MAGADTAVVPDEKLGGYRLDPHHKIGSAKLRFFESFGFDRNDPNRVRRALLAHAKAHSATVTAVVHGLKYEIDGPLETPSGHAPNVRTIWLVEPGKAPRFVSMKPLRRSK